MEMEMIHAIIQEIIASTKKRKKNVYELLYDEFTFFSHKFMARLDWKEE